ncbi:anti-sigma factor [Crenobacter sp. SG2305]|uniref:anti-sigma factor n=1 Tax=Crenobacter oryzisoli TaxID=3056844 RepID=UPI0025AACF37|nr:anti-sigma factor [Crenobacter sp. SG2305]MDN0084754.1 anti-sigma factor [Crenobacter sp. SG2305]
MNYLIPERYQPLAARYVSGVLRGAARSRFEKLADVHPTLQREIVACETLLAPLDVATVPVKPRRRTWRHIEIRLGLRPRHRSHPIFWFLSGMLAAFLISAAVVNFSPQLMPQPELPTPVAVLNDSNGVATMVISRDVARRTLAVTLLQPVDLPAGKVLELWALRRDGTPRSLGLLEGNKPRVSLVAPLSDAAQLAVSIELVGGSPEDKPTGPVVYTGALIIS